MHSQILPRYVKDSLSVFPFSFCMSIYVQEYGCQPEQINILLLLK